MAKKTHLEIQNEIIAKYRVDICDGTKCRNDYSRTHAHVKERRVCKWKQANSIQSTFTLLHEVGHIETTKSTMRRCESEFYATVWALERCKEYGLAVPEKTIEQYQEYIDMEKDRGVRRGGKGYDQSYSLADYDSAVAEFVNKKEIASSKASKNPGFVIKRTVKYDDGVVDVGWVKGVGLMVTLSNREQAKIYPTKAEAQNIVSRIERGRRNESYAIEKA